MRFLVVALLLTVALAPTASAATVLYSEDFDNGALPAGWTTSAGSLWNVGNCFAFVGKALQFNQPTSCNYDTNDAVFGDATTRDYALPATSEPLSLQYESFTSTEFPESGNACQEFDTMHLFVSNNGGATWTPLGEECDHLGWMPVGFDLTPYAGQTIQIRWTFDSVDQLNNYYGGWAIDSFAIVQNAPSTPAPELPAFALALAGITALLGFALVRRKD